MNLFEPYTETKNEQSLLHLKLSAKDRIESVLASRVLPILITIVVALSLISEEIPTSGLVSAALIFLALTAIILLNAKTGVEIFFYETAIEIYSLKMFGKRKETISLKDIEGINLEIFIEPRLSGAFYRLVLKNHKRILLLKIPDFAIQEKDRFILLNKKLVELTQLKIEGDMKYLV